jgi:hypothetical protein
VSWSSVSKAISKRCKDVPKIDIKKPTGLDDDTTPVAGVTFKGRLSRDAEGFYPPPDLSECPEVEFSESDEELETELEAQIAFWNIEFPRWGFLDDGKHKTDNEDRQQSLY